jgi:hypothetical protein
VLRYYFVVVVHCFEVARCFEAVHLFGEVLCLAQLVSHSARKTVSYLVFVFRILNKTYESPFYHKYTLGVCETPQAA